MSSIDVLLVFQRSWGGFPDVWTSLGWPFGRFRTVRGRCRRAWGRLGAMKGRAKKVGSATVLLLTVACCSSRRRGQPQAEPRGSIPPAIPVASMPAPAGTGAGRLTPQDLGYVGAFRLPEAFDWGARGLAYHHSGAGVLLVTGHDQRPAEFAPVAIPQPVRARNPAQLPLATLLGPIRSFDGNIVESITDTAFASGIEVVPRRGGQGSDKLYGSFDHWYGVVDQSHPTVWFSELSGASPRGPFHVGPPGFDFHGNQSGDFLFQVPSDYAARYLGGRTLVTGKTRGAFHGSQGPTLIAFAPFDQEQPSGNLDAVKMLLSYRIKFPQCAGPNVGDPRTCDFPGFTMCDHWEGGQLRQHAFAKRNCIGGAQGTGPESLRGASRW